MRSTPRRVLIAAPAALAASWLAVASAAGATSYSFGGNAYGSTAAVGTIARSGPTSFLSVCTTKTYRHTANAAGLNLGAVGTVGAVKTELHATSSHSTRTSTAIATTAATRLLGGLVQAKAIDTTAVASHDSKGYHLTGSTTFVGLKINGKGVTAKPKANQKITIPNVATVTLNTQTHNSSQHLSAVTGLTVSLLSANRLGLPTGSVVIGRSIAVLQSPVHARPYGSAFGSEIDLAKAVTSGPTAATYLPCGGSAGKTATNHTAAVRIGTAVGTGAVSSSSKSTDSSKKTVATTQAKVAHVNLLGGVVNADAVTAKATATRSKGKLSRSSSGTTVAGLKINGKSVSASVKPNTKINVAGVGTLWLNRSVNSGTQIQVYGIQLQLSTARAGLKAGSVVDIAGARAGVSTS